MESRTEAKLAGISGVLGFALTVIGALMTGDLEVVGTDSEAIIDFYRTASFDAGYRTGVILETLGFLLILAFVAKLATDVDVSDVGSRWLGSVTVASAVVATALTIVTIAAFSAATFRSSHGGLGGDSYVMLEDVRNTAYWLSLMAWAFIYLASGTAIVRRRTFPVWLGWAAIGLGVVHLVLLFLPSSTWDIPVGLGGLWLFAVAVVMLARSRAPGAGRPID